MRGTLGAIVVAMACSSGCAAPAGRPPSLPPEGPPEVGDAEPSPAVPPGATTTAVEQVLVQVEWSEISRTAGCFFFSGPGELGRDDQLGTTARWSTTGDEVALLFAPSLVFRGAMTDDHVVLSRRSSHDYLSKWDIEETIEGAVEGGTLGARYHYSECDTRQRQSCPGRCVIDATVTIVLP
jgi:hypothetical protein